MPIPSGHCYQHMSKDLGVKFLPVSLFINPGIAFAVRVIASQQKLSGFSCKLCALTHEKFTLVPLFSFVFNKRKRKHTPCPSPPGKNKLTTLLSWTKLSKSNLREQALFSLDNPVCLHKVFESVLIASSPEGKPLPWPDPLILFFPLRLRLNV